MLFKGSRPRVLSGFRVSRGLHCAIVLCKSREVEIRMLLVCIIREEKRMEVLEGRRDIYTRVQRFLSSKFNL